MPRIPNPLGPVIRVPADVLAALRMLPSIARDTQRMAQHTEVLRRVADATDALPELREEMARVAAATEEIGRIDARMANIEAAMPVLVDVQRHLSTLPETMKHLDAQLAELRVTLDSLLVAVTPLGRVARRLPGRRRAPEPAT